MKNIADKPPDPDKSRCYDCRFMEAKVNWWCMNDAAAKAHGTRIPGRSGCAFWEAAPYDPKYYDKRKKDDKITMGMLALMALSPFLFLLFLALKAVGFP